jgi:hypothetical protein
MQLKRAMFCDVASCTFMVLVVGLTLRPADINTTFPMTHQFTSTRLHGVTSEKRVLFIVTFARNPKASYATTYFIVIVALSQDSSVGIVTSLIRLTTRRIYRPIINA